MISKIFSDKGVLGINARNLLYIRPYNKKKAIKFADDKLKTKQFLAAREIPVPKLYATIKDLNDLTKFDFHSLPDSFVIKPNHGYGGEGIIPVVSYNNKQWQTAGGKTLNKEDMIEHIKDILDGRFSIAGIGDSAFFEQYIISDERIGQYSYEGLPDIRIVVHNLIPVMAMLRLPTKESGGKANLHQGAVAVGIDISKGESTNIAYKNRIIAELPENKGKIKGLKIPYWDKILYTASKIQLITNLGYLAVDIAIDKHSGPVLLEINARAGLGVQIANLAPLRKRLERIEGIKVSTPEKGVRIAKDMFGNTVEKEIKNLSGKEIIRTEEYIDIFKHEETLRILAKVDTGRERSIIDEVTAQDFRLLEDPEEYNDEKSTLKTKFSLKHKRIQTIVDIEKIPDQKYKMIIGRRDLDGFLVDPKVFEESSSARVSLQKPLNNFQNIDQKLIQIDNKIKLLYHLRPLNLKEEELKFMADTNYNPQFNYPKLSFNPLELVAELNKIIIDTNTELGSLFENKRKEIHEKIALLEAIDEKRFTEISIKLFGNPAPMEVEECASKIRTLNLQRQNLKEAEIYDAKEAKLKFEKAFEKYNLNNWKVKLKENMVADCVAGKNNRLFVKANAKFSRERIESLIVHEIETHIITAENGKSQPYELFNRGLANYLTTQEGMAMYNVEKQRHAPFNKNLKALTHVIAIKIAQEHTFSETYKKLCQFGSSRKQAFRSTVKAKRGYVNTGKSGAFTKDYIYYKGHKLILEFMENGGDLRDLYIGKFDVKDLPHIKKLPNISAPKILPDWLK